MVTEFPQYSKVSGDDTELELDNFYFLFFYTSALMVLGLQYCYLNDTFICTYKGYADDIPAWHLHSNRSQIYQSINQYLSVKHLNNSQGARQRSIKKQTFATNKTVIVTYCIFIYDTDRQVCKRISAEC